MPSRVRGPFAGERITVGFGAAESSVWQVMVSRLRLIVGWETDSGISTFEYTCIFPPLLVPNTSANAMWHQLFFSQLTGPIFRALSLLRARAKHNVDLSETDGAAANYRFRVGLVSFLYVAGRIGCFFVERGGSAELVGLAEANITFR